MPSQRILDEWRGKYAPAFPVDGVQFAVERLEDGRYRFHAWLMFEDVQTYHIQPSSPIKETDLEVATYRVEFPHRVVLDARPGRTDVR